MNLKQIWLWNFRNYEETSLSFRRTITLLQAENSQGKSNFLEAILYLSSLSSPRYHSPQEMIRHGMTSLSIKGTVEDKVGERELVIYLGERERRLWMGGKRIAQPGRYWNKLPTVMFSPDDLALVAENHELRRRFLDRCRVRENRDHLQEMARLRRILIQRNQAIKARDKVQLPYWDEQLAISWRKIFGGRMAILSRLNLSLPPLLRSLGCGKGVCIRYQPSLADESGALPSDPSQALRKGEEREMRVGYSLYGPHRDGVVIELDGYDVRRFSSRGEKRLLTLALKLFERSHLQEMRGEPPVVLLDDLFSELDEERRTYVAASLLSGGQALVTCTDLSLVQALLPEAEAFRIREGRIERSAGN